MKLLSSFLVAAYANGHVDKTKCHEIDGFDEKYRSFAAKRVDVVVLESTHTALELIPADAQPNGVNPDGIPNCLVQCDDDIKCLFVVHDTSDNSCSMAKVKADQTETIFKR